MSVELNPTESSNYSRSDDHRMPQITAFLSDCLAPVRKTAGTALRVPLDEFEPSESRPVSIESLTVRGEGAQTRNRSTSSAPQTGLDLKPISEQVGVRSLVRFISHHFNNILMGIWGNLYLMRIALEANHPLQARIAHTENLIQDGSFFIHLILGYLAERRELAKRLRLIQMLNEMAVYIPDAFTRRELARQLQTNEALRRPRWVAANTAGIMEQLLNDIEDLTRRMPSCEAVDADLQEKAAKVEALVSRARELTTQLGFYAGLREPRRTWFDMKNLILFKYRRMKENYPALQVGLTIAREETMVWADRAQIAWMLNEVIEEACRKVAADGSPQVVACSWSSRGEENIGRCSSSNRIFEISITRRKHASEEQLRAVRRERGFKTSVLAIGTRIRRAGVESILKIHGGYLRRFSQGGRDIHHLFIPAHKIRTTRELR